MEKENMNKYQIRKLICYFMIALVVCVTLYFIIQLSIAYSDLKGELEDLELNIYSTILMISSDTKHKLTLNFVKHFFLIIAIATFIITILMLILRNTSDLENLERGRNKNVKNPANETNNETDIEKTNITLTKDGFQ